MWTPLMCFAVIAVIYVVSEFISNKTNGYVSSLVIASLVFIAGFWSGVLPADVTTKSVLPGLMVAFGVPLLITNLGTIIDLEDILSEWKTVVIALTGLGGIAIICFTIGTALFGREYALTAAPPISGGTIAGIIVSDIAKAAGRPELGAFAILVLAFQGFCGMPIATLCLKKEINDKLKRGELDGAVAKKTKIKLPAMRLLRDVPKKYDTSTMNFAKLSIVAVIAYFVAIKTMIPGSSPANYWLNPNIAFLLFGLIFARINFLPKNAIAKAGADGMLMFAMLGMLPGNFATITPAQLLDMLAPIAGLLGLSAVGIAIVAVVTGKMVGYSPAMSIAIGITAMIGYPGTQILSNEAVASMEGATEEQRQRALEHILPKMIVGGFTTVTIASVAFAGIIAPMIFN